MTFRPVPVAAFLTDRHPDLVRRWARAGLVRTERGPRNALLVHLGDLARLDLEKGTRRGGPEIGGLQRGALT